MQVRKVFLNIFIFCISLYFSMREIPKFTDDLNYLNYIEFAHIHISNLGLALKDNIFNLIPKEGLWLSIAYFFSLFFDKITALRVIIFLSSFFFLKFFIRANNYNVLNTFMLAINPQFVTNYVLHLRQGVAMTVYYGGKYYLKFAVVAALSIFVHSSFLIFLAYDIISKALGRYDIGFNKKVYLNILLSLVFAFSSSLYFLFFSDDKKDLYESFVADTSGLGFVFWLIMLVFFLIDLRKISVQNRDNYIMSIFGISFYIFSYYTNSFGARVFESFLPVVVLSLSSFTKHKRTLIYIMLFLYSILQWFARGGLNF